MEPLLLEHAVANWLATTAKELLVPSRNDQWPDFELRTADGTLLLVELKSKPPRDSSLQFMARRFEAIDDSAARFLLVTPVPPSDSDRLRFARVFQSLLDRAQWLTIQNLPTVLGKPSPGPWDSPMTWAQLQTSALVKGLEEYKQSPVGPTPYSWQKPSTDIQALARQFPYNAIARLIALPGTPENNLGLGSRCPNVTVVLSDIVNFSNLVSASGPDD